MIVGGIERRILYQKAMIVSENIQHSHRLSLSIITANWETWVSINKTLSAIGVFFLIIQLKLIIITSILWLFLLNLQLLYLI